MNAQLQRTRSKPADDWKQAYGLIKPTMSENEAAQFAEWILSFQKRPWDWVMACYPWRVPGSPLAGRLPERWQREWLMKLQLQLQRDDLTPDELRNRVIRLAVASGHGVGKTSLVAMVIHWFVSCYPCGEAVITASTEAQLSTKTWRELRKWQNRAINGWQMEWSATRYKHRDMPELWYAEAKPWSESNPQAFAGTHEKYVLIIFDEASGIAADIWEVVQGALTTGLVFMFAFGNPTETEGGFYDCFNRFRTLWIPMRVDARTVTFANRAEIEGWRQLWGEDSDFFRTRVRGLFPKTSQSTFISAEDVAKAKAIHLEWRHMSRSLPRLMGVDLARQGSDMNAIVKRVGRKVDPRIKQWSERDTMVSVAVIVREINEWQPDRVYVDGVGLGGPIVDLLRLKGYARIITDVQSGARCPDPDDYKRYANMRTCMWSRMREYIRSCDLPDDPELEEELCAPKFRFETKTDRMLLQPKAEMESRSPNKADALAFTFWDLTPTSSTTNSGYAEPSEV